MDSASTGAAKSSLLWRKGAGLSKASLGRCGEEDELATVKVLSAALLYPVTWLVLAGIATALYGPLAGLVTLSVAPALCYLALVFREHLSGTVATFRAVWLWLFRRQAMLELVEERRVLKELMRSIAESLSV